MSRRFGPHRADLLAADLASPDATVAPLSTTAAGSPAVSPSVAPASTGSSSGRPASLRLPNCITRLREERGWTKEQLSTRSKVQRDQLRRVEHSLVRPKWSSIERIASAFQVEPMAVFPWLTGNTADALQATPETHEQRKARFDAKVFRDGVTTCHLWSAGVSRFGYGVFSWRTTSGASPFVAAHRAAYMMAHGIDTLSPEIFVCHRCDVPSCVNPDHLFLGTAKDNSLDASRKGRLEHGSARYNAKLTNVQVAAIRNRLAVRKHGDVAIVARELGVSASLISMLLHRQIWKRAA